MKQERNETTEVKDVFSPFIALQEAVRGRTIVWAEQQNRVSIIPGIPSNERLPQTPITIIKSQFFKEAPITIFASADGKVLVEKIEREDVVRNLPPQERTMLKDDGLQVVITDGSGKQTTWANAEFSFITGLLATILATSRGGAAILPDPIARLRSHPDLSRIQLKRLYSEVEVSLTESHRSLQWEITPKAAAPHH